MNLLVWAVFGIASGVAAHFLDPIPTRGGVVAAIFFGLLGAVGGGLIASITFGTSISGFDLILFIVAAAGAFLFLLIERSFFTRNFPS